MEFAIGKKFLGEIYHNSGERYEDLKQGPQEPADLVCKRANGSCVEIQVAELIDQYMLSVRTMRKLYKEAIETEHPDILRKFRGCYVAIDVPGIPNYLPRITSKGGRRCLRELVSGLVDLSSDIETIEIGKSS